MLMSVLIGSTSCSRNPLGEEISQPILNAGFQLTHACNLNALQDQAYACSIEAAEDVAQLQWSLEAGSTCAWMTVNASGALVGTANDDQVGSCLAIVRATSPTRQSAPLSVELTVQNVVPTLNISPVTLAEDSPLSVIRADTDVQSNEEGFGVYSIVSPVGSPSCGTFSQALSADSLTGAISYQPALDFEGACYVRIRFDDQNLNPIGQIESEFLVTVTPVNDAPVINPILAQTMTESTTFNVPVVISDIDSTLICATALSYTSSQTSVVASVGGVVFSGTAPNCVAAITPVVSVNGSTVLTFTVSDGALADSESFTLNVIPQNDPPVVAVIAAQTMLEDGTLAIPFQITDVDDTLFCNSSVTMLTSDSSLLPAGNVVFSGTAPNCIATVTPLADQFGILDVTLVVSDGLLTASRLFSLNIQSVNDLPVVSVIAGQSLKTDSAVVIPYTISDIDHSLDCASSITVTSANVVALPNGDLVKGGTAPNCTLTISPSANTAASVNVTVQASDGIGTTSRTFAVSLIRVNSIAVTPSTSTIGNGGSQQFSAVVTYSDATTLDVTSSALATWSSANAALATVNNAGSKGLVSGVSAGAVSISATYKSVVGSASVTVISILSVSVSQSVVSGGIGSQVSLSATAQSNVSTFDVTTTAVWSTSNPAVATVAGGVISLVSAGTAVITVTYGGLSTVVNVTVLAKSLVSIAITAAGGFTVQQNGSKPFVATATYSDASTEVVTNSAVWSSGNTSVLTVSNTLPNVGRGFGIAGGTSTLTATVGSVSGSVLVTINSPTLLSIAVTPFDVLYTSNSSAQYRATGTYSDATTADITELVTWSSSNLAAATISNVAGSKGRVSTLAVVGYQVSTISATLSAVTGTSPLGVNGSTVTGLVVTPTITITAGQTYSLQVMANLADGGSIDVTEFAVWQSGTPASVTVSNSIGSKGVVTGVATGTSNITAHYSGFSGSRVVTVGAVPVVTPIGTGLTGTYYTYTVAAPPSFANAFLPANRKGSRVDARVSFDWGNGNAPMGIGNIFSVMWTGQYRAAVTGDHFFCTRSDDGVRFTFNGVVRFTNWTNHGAAWDCTAAISLVANTNYPIIIEYFENSGGSIIQFTQSNVSALDARNATTRLVPQVQLFPN